MRETFRSRLSTNWGVFHRPFSFFCTIQLKIGALIFYVWSNSYNALFKMPQFIYSMAHNLFNLNNSMLARCSRCWIALCPSQNKWVWIVRKKGETVSYNLIQITKDCFIGILCVEFSVWWEVLFNCYRIVSISLLVNIRNDMNGCFCSATACTR